MVLVQPAEFGVADQVLHRLLVRAVGIRREDPADVGLPEAVGDGRVQVFRGVRGAVVVPALRRPPDRPRCEALHPSQAKTNWNVRLVLYAR